MLSGRERPAGAVAVDEVDDALAVRIGEKDDIAEPGRAGRLFAAIAAFFCASSASLSEGFGGPVLFARARPGRTTGLAFLGELGLPGSFWRSLSCAGSRVDIVKSALAGHICANGQKVPRIFSLTPGLGSARPFLMHFSTRSRPPACSIWLLWCANFLSSVFSHPAAYVRGWTFLSWHASQMC